MTHTPLSADVPDAWPADDLEPAAGCPACGATTREQMHDGLRDRLFGAPGTWTMWRCTACGSGHLDPRPTPASIGLAYADYFWHQAPRDLEEDLTGTVAQLRRAVRNDVLNRRLGYALPVTPRAAGAALSTTLGPTFLGAAIERWARHLPFPGPGARLLDVGCANGEFLLQLRALGWACTGIDVDDQALGQARDAGLDVLHATLTEPGELAGRRFDAITLSHVIEHLHDPAAALRGAYELLEPGGVLWIATPNIRSLAHHVFGRDWLSLDPPRHLVLFTPEALRGAAAAAGFRDVRTPRPVRNAVSVFSASAALQRGLRPDDAPPLPWALALRALGADRVWERRSAVAEELVVIARR